MKSTSCVKCLSTHRSSFCLPKTYCGQWDLCSLTTRHPRAHDRGTDPRRKTRIELHFENTRIGTTVYTFWLAKNYETKLKRLVNPSATDAYKTDAGPCSTENRMLEYLIITLFEQRFGETNAITHYYALSTHKIDKKPINN